MFLMLPPNKLRFAWQGIISLQYTDEWVMPWRIPFEDRGLFPPEKLQERAATPAGVRISFYSNTRNIIGEVVPCTGSALLDLFCDGRFHESLEINGQNNFVFQTLPKGEKLIELWLPQSTKFRLKFLNIDKSASFVSYADPRPKWITYGSSITHCGGAERPSNTWPAIVAREHGLNLTCLGYGGSCHLEPMVARMIRDLPADFISLKIGINIQARSVLNLNAFGSAIIEFIKIIREKHKNTPLAVISPIYSPPREQLSNVVGVSLEGMREEIARAVNIIKNRGDMNIYYINGLNLFGSNYVHFLPDDVHPDAEGYKVIAKKFLSQVAEPIFVKPSTV